MGKDSKTLESSETSNQQKTSGTRDEKGRLQKGTPSLNPGGRPKGLAARVREMTDDGTQLIEMYRDIAFGKVKATTRDRIEAGKILLERGFGKAHETVLTGELPGAPKEELAALSMEQLEALATLPTPAEPDPMATQVAIFDESREPKLA
jgi:hypothetical protein